MKRSLALMVSFLIAALSAHALDIGDKAPELHPLKWVTGEPATVEPDGKRIYIVEVWSTTCPPCTATIPILNDLNKRYADQVKIISFTTDKEEDVTPYLADHPIEYSSFVDDEGASFVKYMAADNRDTIPHAFLFDKEGRLLWIGNPLDSLEKRIQSVLDGTLTYEHAVAVRDAEEALQNAVNGQNVPQMLSSIQQLEELEPSNGRYYQFHYRMLTQLGIGDDAAYEALMNGWFAGCRDSAEDLMILSAIAFEQGHPLHRNPRLALAAARRAYDIAGDIKAEAGVTLAEIYKSIGRVDLALTLLDELLATAQNDQREALEYFKKFYTQLHELGQNPESATAQ